MRGWAITDYTATYEKRDTGDGKTQQVRISAQRTRVHPETGAERRQVWNEATGWVAEEGEA